MSKAAWTALDEASRQKGFAVANVAQLDMITQVWEALDHAIAEGQTLDEFREAIGDALERAWAGSVANPAWRLETVFRTNIQLAYGAGRYAQATDPDVLEVRPYWMFDAILDARTSAICEECNGTVRPADDSWWSSHQPPLHHNCRSTFLTLSEEQAREFGVTARAPKAAAADGFGRAPGADEWAPDEGDYPPELWSEFQAKTR
ncbi:MAG TPA: phage minor head protein [Polyangiaceae bacterium]|nr:phage minor head protein [Polyangiaceae bacterium]